MATTESVAGESGGEDRGVFLDCELVDQRDIRHVSPWRLFWTGVFFIFLLDIVGHTITLYWRGYPVTIQTVYAQGTRAGHAEVWVVCCALVLCYGALVARSFVRAVLGFSKEGES